MSSLNASAVVGVGVLLFRADGALLIGHRNKREEAASWCLPGGNVEAMETFEEAALRELAEETGIRGVADAAVFAVALDTRSDVTRVTVGVAARVEDAAATTTEPEVFDRWIWAELNDLPEPLFPASAAVLHAYRGEPGAPGWVLYSTTGAPLHTQERR